MYRKLYRKLMAVLTAALILSGSFPMITTHAGQVSEESSTSLSTKESTTEEAVEIKDTQIPDKEITAENGSEQAVKDKAPEQADDGGNSGQADDGDSSGQADKGNAPGSEIPAEAPVFQAHIEYRMGLYFVIGIFEDFTPDIIRIQTMYSFDGQNWQTDTENVSDWHLPDFDSGSISNPTCVLNSREPLKSYLAGKTDRFFLKLLITEENGLSYETQSAVIERGGLQALPDGAEIYAMFPSDVIPGSLSYYAPKYASYQFTVPADATAEEIAALLPKTVPVEIQFLINTRANLIAIGVIDYPVTWKPLSLPRLTPGETVTVTDAAEEIVVPAGTQVSTPLGIFQTKEALSLDMGRYTDEVRLILNVKPAERKSPSGVLKDELRKLKIALNQKPTGATSIRAYILTEGEAEWAELSGLSLLEEFYQPSTESTGYALLLRDDQDPYRSYLAAIEAGETPVPFFVGLKIEGGVYDGAEIILSWPDVYEQLPDLPKIRGAQGNEGNAGADNKADSTESGQRPSLPQPPNDSHAGQPLSLEQNDSHAGRPQVSVPDGSKEEPLQVSESNDNPEEQQIPETIADTDSVMPEIMTPSSDGSVNDDPSAGQRPGLPRMASEFSDADQGGSPKLVPPVVQAATDTVAEKQASALSDPEVTMGQSAKNDSRIPPLPVTAAVSATAAVCIGAAFGKSAGYSFLRRIAGKVFKMLHHIK